MIHNKKNIFILKNNLGNLYMSYKMRLLKERTFDFVMIELREELSFIDNF